MAFALDGSAWNSCRSDEDRQLAIRGTATDASFDGCFEVDMAGGGLRRSTTTARLTRPR